ncbi:MAG: glycosyltransferase family A protein, partial [Verrucomicrobiales bacterium]
MTGIAVVIPVFNRATLLPRAVESVLAQTCRPQELVVVDDGSDDDAGTARARIEASGYRWLSLDWNQGVAAARNAGVRATSTKWIAFLDSDDEWQSEKLERQLAWHERHPEVRISQTREKWERNGAPVAKPIHWEPVEEEMVKASRRRCMIGPSCVMIRRDLWDETGGFDERFRVCEDFELWLRITASNRVGLVDGEALVTKFGGHQDQLSITTPALDRHRIVALLEFLNGGDVSEEDRADIIEVIKEKAVIVANGAGKRGDRVRENFFRSLSVFDHPGSKGLIDSFRG